MHPNTPGPVEIDMRPLIQGEIDEIREAIYRRKRSDSFPSNQSFLVKEEPSLREYVSTQDLKQDEY